MWISGRQHARSKVPVAHINRGKWDAAEERRVITESPRQIQATIDEGPQRRTSFHFTVTRVMKPWRPLEAAAEQKIAMLNAP